jgi:antitoxin component YwqK of YwqJK toxin-antitoxin module
MKRNIFLLTLVFFACIELNLYSQIIVVQQDSSMIYLKSKLSGKTYMSKKVGLWTDKAANGTIYCENYYDSIGNPSGIWKYNFPNGTIRFSKEYSNIGAINFSIYRYNRIIAEVVSESKIPDSILRFLEKYETELYKRENLIIGTKKTTNSDVTWQGKCSLSADPFNEIHKISEILIYAKFSGKLTIWSADKTISIKCEYSQGNEYKIAYSYNKKQEVTKQDEFKDGIIVKTITFKSNGEQKIKTY